MPTASLTCVRCDLAKPEDQFVRDRTRTSGRFPWCKSCVIERRREYKARDATRRRRPAREGERACPNCLKSLEGEKANRQFCGSRCKDRARALRTFGLTPADHRALIAATGGRCPICDREPKKWALDHDHSTGEVTGVVCSVCNQSLLAYSRHEVATAQRLLDYLTSPPLPAVLGERRFVGPATLEQLDRIKGWRRARGYNVGMAQVPYLRNSYGADSMAPVPDEE